MNCFTNVVFIIVLLIILKIILKLFTGWDKSQTCLVGKTAIVTGANTGIGFYTALDFAKRGARVILACRDKTKVEKAKAEIIEATDNSNVVVRIVDFASLASVREFAKEINKTEERLDILVNNAGAAGSGDITTKDGLNILMQVNYFGPFLLTILLINLLKKSAPSRIVNVSSVFSYFSKLDTNNLSIFPKHFPAKLINYGNSKLCNILFTNELARKLKGTGVTANSLHPGFIATAIWSKLPFILTTLASGLSNTFFKTPEEGAQTSIFVAVSKNVEGVTGEYFDNCRIAWLPSMPKAAQDEDLAKRVWESSEDLVKLTAEEKKLL